MTPNQRVSPEATTSIARTAGSAIRDAIRSIIG
jgi:hypothetical protein